MMYDPQNPTEEQLKLRRYSFKILSAEFPNQQNVYTCIDEWISKGQVTSNGIASYYDAYYVKK